MKPFLDQKVLLEKFPGKGGWTYAVIPEILQDKTKPFGWVKVKGSIENYEFENYHLMPMGNNRLFLPVKASIRKIIKKEAGDLVHILLHPETIITEIPSEFTTCLQLDRNATHFFNTLTFENRINIVQWIYNTNTELTKEKRLVQVIQNLSELQIPPIIKTLN